MPLPQPAQMAAASPAPEPTIIVQRQEVSDVLLAAFATLGYAVSARFLLFLGLVGAFALAVMAMISQQLMAMIVLGMYSALIVLPLVFLEMRSKRGG